MTAASRPSRHTTISKRVDALDWAAINNELDMYGAAAIRPILTSKQCDELIDAYDADALYRTRTIMAQHGYGRGEYKYFKYPLPPTIADLRESLYRHLAKIANRWNESMRIDVRYPGTHKAFKARCHAAGQIRPTPLILKYEVGDYNCLHQDIYGAHVFPLQIAFLLSKPGDDFTGGEFTLTEQRLRKQSRAEVVPLTQGMGVIFPVHHRPVKGTKGVYRVNMRHGVSRVRSGQRFTMGIIFHDGK
jgi:hypothetical protein